MDALRCIPLGGLGEIGRNMMVLEYGEDIVIVDVGVMFPENEMLGVDLVIPDVSYLMDKRERIRGIVITHGHEDHTGSLPYVLPQLNFPPVWGTPLTLGLINGKLKEHRLQEQVTLNTITPGEKVQFGKLEAEFFRVCHSIPDGVGVALRTPVGLVVHSGDFKFDYTPVDGRPTDFASLARFGREGVLCLFADSTHADRPGYTPSEAVVGEALDSIIGNAKGRVIVTTFASLISRIQQIVDAAARHERKVGIIGRSMVQNVAVAQELGFIKAPPGVLLKPEEMSAVSSLPPRNVVLVTTGSQGEPTSALTRMANRDHRQIEIVPGDTVVMSAAPVPGNEELVSRTIDNLFRLGANVVWGHGQGAEGSRGTTVHVSGHASQEELKLMLSLLKPRYFVPVHGEYRHLILHARLAQSLGIAAERIMVIEDGDVLEVTPEEAQVCERVSAGYVFVDGLGVGDVGQVVLRDRQLLSQDGILIITLTVDRLTGRPVAGPDISSRGFVYVRENEELIEKARAQVTAAIEQANVSLSGDQHHVDWQFVKNKIRDTLSKYVYEQTRRRPMILPVVMEV
ncbi:MAG TPA: ribonuclease J [Chloroflexota bacterium]|jgi:ribonuclease J|nr:ribonuclease J [Chloroflexota bacterium]